MSFKVGDKIYLTMEACLRMNIAPEYGDKIHEILRIRGDVLVIVPNIEYGVFTRLAIIPTPLNTALL